MTNHPCGEFLVITHALEERESARLLPCPFCGRAATLALVHHKNRLAAFCRGIGEPPCPVKPSISARRRVFRGWVGAHLVDQAWQVTFDELVKAWNTRAPAASGEVSR